MNKFNLQAREGVESPSDTSGRTTGAPVASQPTRRVDVKAILADERLRRELMVPTIQAIQAREGINTTREQAERAYDKVRAEALEER